MVVEQLRLLASLLVFSSMIAGLNAVSGLGCREVAIAVASRKSYRRVGAVVVSAVLMLVPIAAAAWLIAYPLIDVTRREDDLVRAVAAIASAIFALQFDGVVRDVGGIRMFLAREHLWRAWEPQAQRKRMLEMARVAHARNMLDRLPLLVTGETAFIAAVVGGRRGQDEEFAAPIDLVALVAGPLVVFFVLRAYAMLVRTTSPGPSLLRAVVCQPGSKFRETYKVSRWRSRTHAMGFSVGRSIERCLPSLRRRLTAEQYNSVCASYRKVAHSVRTLGSSADRSAARSLRLNILCLMGATIVTTNDIVGAARRIDMVLRSDPDPPPVASSKVLQRLDVANSVLQRYARLIQAATVATTALVLLAVGQGTVGFEFIQSVIRR